MAALRIPLPIPPIHPKYRRLSVLALAVAGAFGFGLAVALLFAGGAARFAPPVVFTETFDGSPGAPQPWHPANWDVTVHSRDGNTWQTLEPMAASHGADCAGPPAEHQNSSYEGAVFLCKDHVMTAINAPGYGLIYLTPPAQMDWSQGEAVLRFDMSTLRTSPRDWVDFWVTPYEDNVQFALDEWLPDGNGLPRRAIHIRMDNSLQGSMFRVELVNNFEVVAEYQTYQPGLEGEFANRGLTTSASRRDTFELLLRPGHIKFWLPQYGIVAADTNAPGLTWTRGVVQLGHHSYTPTKDCTPNGTTTCLPDTWHWDNVSISPSVPFTILRGDRRAVGASQSGPMALPAPAPAGSSLRFMGIGTNLEVSYNGGASWVPALKQAFGKPEQGEIFKSYWMPIPQGTTQLQFRGQSWFGGDWAVRDVSVWSQGTPPPGIASPTPTRTPTATAIPALPTSTRTPVPATVVATATRTVAPTRTATTVPATPTTVPPGTSVPATATVVVAATATPPPAAGALCVRYLVTDGRLVDEQPPGCNPLRRS